MTFTNQHHLLTVFGSAFGVETWSFGVRFYQTTFVPVTQAMADACKTPVLTWWNTTGLFMPSSHILQGVKVADIDVDGHYPPLSSAKIGDITDTQGGTSTNNHPAQCAMVATLISSIIPRGRGSKGRIYVPHPSVAISNSGGKNGMQTAMAAAVATLLTSLNAVSGLGIASVMSNIGTGLTSPIGSVRCDNIPDVQRRRARQLVGDRATSTVT